MPSTHLEEPQRSSETFASNGLRFGRESRGSTWSRYAPQGVRVMCCIALLRPTWKMGTKHKVLAWHSIDDDDDDGDDGARNVELIQL